MGAYKYIQELFRGHDRSLLKERIIEWRRSNAVVRIERPTNIVRARSLGYKAKKGYILVRVKLGRGGRKRPQIKKGRRPKANRRKKVVGKSYQWIAEERANKNYKNCEVVGSYQIAKDGQYYYFEVILGDRILLGKYPKTKHFAYTKGRVFRGLTSAGRKSRGLRKGKGKGHEKNRPSLRAHGRRGKN